MRRGPGAVVVLLALLVVAGCAHRGVETTVEPVGKGWSQKGLASWYGKPYHGRRAASGEIYDMHELTAAHKTLPFGTRVRVTRRDTGQSVVVRINDRGPFVKGRIIDLSYAAAKKIGLDRDGVAPVRLEVVGTGDRPPKRAKKGHEKDRPCFWVQVGAFAEAAHAEAARDRLADEGEHAVVLEGPGGIHRVRVGPFESEKEAKKAWERLRRHWPSAALLGCG